jgi:hypothetical protein
MAGIHQAWFAEIDNRVRKRAQALARRPCRARRARPEGNAVLTSRVASTNLPIKIKPFRFATIHRSIRCSAEDWRSYPSRKIRAFTVPDDLAFEMISAARNRPNARPTPCTEWFSDQTDAS